MNIRQAMYAAADSIEKHPNLFNFGDIYIPDCGTPGCALGWIGFHMGVTGISEIIVPPLLGLDKFAVESGGHRDFYTLMDGVVSSDWMYSAEICAAGLRKYADKYHPDVGINIPDSVIEIFNSKTVVGEPQ